MGQDLLICLGAQLFLFCVFSVFRGSLVVSLRETMEIRQLPLNAPGDAKGVSSYQPGATPQEQVREEPYPSAKGAIHRSTATSHRLPPTALVNPTRNVHRIRYETGRWPSMRIRCLFPGRWPGLV